MDSAKGSKKKNVFSLADLLAKNSQSGSGAQTRSKTSSLEELKKQLNGNQGSSTNLNISKALSIGGEKMKLMDISQIKLEDSKNQRLSVIPPKNMTAQNINLNSNSTGKGSKAKNVKFENISNIKSDYSTDSVNRTHREYQRMIAKAEKEKFLSFDEEDQDTEDERMSRTANFNLLRLPKDLNLEKGRLNVYKSGIIEILTNDPTPKVYRFKPTVFHADSNPTTLIIANDSQAYLDCFEVYQTSTLSQN